MREMSPEGEEVIKTGKLYLVDLAGSENVNRQAPPPPCLSLPGGDATAQAQRNKPACLSMGAIKLRQLPLKAHMTGLSCG